MVLLDIVGDESGYSRVKLFAHTQNRSRCRSKKRDNGREQISINESSRKSSKRLCGPPARRILPNFLSHWQVVLKSSIIIVLRSPTFFTVAPSDPIAPENLFGFSPTTLPTRVRGLLTFHPSTSLARITVRPLDVYRHNNYANLCIGEFPSSAQRWLFSPIPNLISPHGFDFITKSTHYIDHPDGR